MWKRFGRLLHRSHNKKRVQHNSVVLQHVGSCCSGITSASHAEGSVFKTGLFCIQFAQARDSRFHGVMEFHRVCGEIQSITCVLQFSLLFSFSLQVTRADTMLTVYRARLRSANSENFRSQPVDLRSCGSVHVQLKNLQILF